MEDPSPDGGAGAAPAPRPHSPSPGRKRRRRGTAPGGAAPRDAYRGWRFVPVPATGRPGTPHRRFEASYRGVAPDTSGDASETGPDGGDPVPRVCPVVHRHANGLCVVTAGPGGWDDVASVQLLVPTAAATSPGDPEDSAPPSDAHPRPVRGQTLLEPSDVLARITLRDGTIRAVPAGVRGAVLELNPRLSAARLREDPMLDGYLAVLRPVGPFPPVEEAGGSAVAARPGAADPGARGGAMNGAAHSTHTLELTDKKQ